MKDFRLGLETTKNLLFFNPNFEQPPASWKTRPPASHLPRRAEARPVPVVGRDAGLTEMMLMMRMISTTVLSVIVPISNMFNTVVLLFVIVPHF